MRFLGFRIEVMNIVGNTDSVHAIFITLALFRKLENIERGFLCNFSFGGRQDPRFGLIVSPDTHSLLAQ
jgi:hypothetical protein